MYVILPITIIDYPFPQLVQVYIEIGYQYIYHINLFVSVANHFYFSLLLFHLLLIASYRRSFEQKTEGERGTVGRSSV